MTNTEASLHQQKQQEEDYNTWLQSNNVQVASNLVETTVRAQSLGGDVLPRLILIRVPYYSQFRRRPAFVYAVVVLVMKVE